MYRAGRSVKDMTIEELLDFVSNKTAANGDPLGKAREEIIRRFTIAEGLAIELGWLVTWIASLNPDGEFDIDEILKPSRAALEEHSKNIIK